jgi:hypothetical protein
VQINIFSLPRAGRVSRGLVTRLYAVLMSRHETQCALDVDFRKLLRMFTNKSPVMHKSFPSKRNCHSAYMKMFPELRIRHSRAPQS